MESVTWGKVGHPGSAKILAMIPLLRHCLGWLIAAFQSREDLILENLALRQQLLTLHAKRPRPRLGSFDKLFWVALRKIWPGWRTSLILVTPQTVIPLASHRLSFVLGMAFAPADAIRQKANRQRSAGADLPYGCREPDLGSTAHSRGIT